MSDGENIHVRVQITGRVQGVWYRGWTVDTARVHGLDGWVRNRADGTVEAVFSGPDHAVDAMIAACWRGPTSARVQNIKCTDALAPPLSGFHQKPSL